MRRLALALLVVLLAAGCMSREPRHDRSKEVSYNRRELPPNDPGILSGPDGQWTIYESGRTREDPGPTSEGPDPACEGASPDDENEACDTPAGQEP